MAKDFLPKIITWFRLDEHVRRLKTSQEELEVRVETLEDAPSGGGELPYKVYTALLTQTGTDAPVATVLENTLGDIVWSRQDAGVYLANSNSLFTENKTFLNLSFNYGNDVTGSANGLTFIQNEDIIYLETGLIGDANFDSILRDTPVEIRVYN